jgi:hypothetical protein
MNTKLLKMKKTILIVLTTFMSWATFAQSDSAESKQLEIQIEEDILVLESENFNNLELKELSRFIADATMRIMNIQQQNKRLQEAITRAEAEGKISAEQAQELRAKLEERTEQSMERAAAIMESYGESYAQRMEAWADEEERQTNAWAEKLEGSIAQSDSTLLSPPPLPPVPPAPKKLGKKQEIVINKDGITIVETDEDGNDVELRLEDDDEEEDIDADDFFNLEKKSKKIRRTDNYFHIALGFNQQLEDGIYLIEEGPGTLEFWRSTAFNLGYGGKTRLGSPYSKLYLKYGIDFSWHDFNMQENTILKKDAERGAFFEADDDKEGLDQNKYHIAYFNIPLMLELDFSETGRRDDAFTLGLGGYGGVRLRSKRELEFNTPIFDDVEEEVFDPFFTNQFRYGLMAQVGYGNFKITASYDLNNFFRRSEFAPYNMAAITFGFVW